VLNVSGQSKPAIIAGTSLDAGDLRKVHENSTVRANFGVDCSTASGVELPREPVTPKVRTLRSWRDGRYDRCMSSASNSFEIQAFPAFRRALSAWYRRHARELPWRQTHDPYRIWISEIMLQQTTVAAVIPYFERFLQRFPDVAALAAAPEEDVLRLWEGLGYYSRARNIHRAARLVVDDLGGQFPEAVDALQALPGVGRYTAGAISSFAFDRPAPIVEANTLRLYSRLLGMRTDPRSTAGQKLLWEFAEAVLPRTSPGQFNQALMELGARVCTPERPACDKCPVRRWCVAFAEGTQQEIPVAARRPAVTEVTEVAVVIERNRKLLLRRRPAGERWAGLWDFVRFSWDDEADLRSTKSARSVKLTERVIAAIGNRVARETGVVAEVVDKLTEIRHSVTRYRITLACFHAEWKAGDSSGESKWVTREELSEFPLSVTGRKIARLLQEKRTGNTLF